jgi:pyruvate/2-oxoglutarate dehydrogenase complex dihydrolipoamide acyltransferase (E2) component
MAAVGVFEIVMPQLGVSVAEGTLVAWHKQPGEDVAADEAICDVASDKIDSEIPAPCAGRIETLLVEVGETVEVGTVIATMAAQTPGGVGSEPAPAATPAGDGAERGERGVAGDGHEPTGSGEAHEPVPAGDGGERGERHSPVVARMAAELGVDLDGVLGSGRDGRIRKEDVLAAAQDAQAGDAGAYVPPAPVELSRMRVLIGEHMRRSLATAATVTQWIEVDFSAIEARRRAEGVTALPVVAAATIATLAEFPDLNAWLADEVFTRHTDVNLGIAVSLGTDGLIVPVIRAAQTLTVAELGQRIRELAQRARTGELSADDVRDGTFTITNPGQWGTIMATPVITQPQVAILDVEAIVRRPVVVTAPDGAEEIAIRPICILGLSWDHRALDGAYAGQFLTALRRRLETDV